VKTNLPEITKAYLGAATFFTIASEGLMLAASKYQLFHRPDYLLPVIVGFGLPALPFGFYLAARVAYLARPPGRVRPMYPNQGGNFFSSLASFIAPQPKAPPGGFTFGDGPPAKILKYKPKADPEFIFWEQGMDSMITEIRLLGFCKIAWRRQQNVLYGKLNSNQVFSREYFTREARPRFPLPDYHSIMHILMSRSLILNRWRGKGGQLHFPAYSTVEEAKARWKLSS
jgi:hypothetical protein